VRLLCEMMQVSRSAYYNWLTKDDKPPLEEELLKNKVKRLFEQSRKTYGSRRLVNSLNEEGYSVGRFKIRRLMRELELQARYPKRFKVTTDSNHQLEVASNTLNRQFMVSAPNQVWTTDISYVWTLEGWMYVAVVMDLYSRQIVGWAVDDHMRTSLCLKALGMAYWRRKPSPGLLHHSDRGSQYASHAYREQLHIMQMEQSMSRKGDCWDNAPTERFFRSMKYEWLNYERFATKALARIAIVDYLTFYNGQRIHSVLGYKTPMLFEQEFYNKIA
jgi:putative transposase